MTPEFEAAYYSFYWKLTDLLAGRKEAYSRDLLTFRGKRYIKLVFGSAAFCFIDMTNGNVLKPESWSKPAPHARGNIFDEHNGMGKMTQYGPKYLKEGLNL